MATDAPDDAPTGRRAAILQAAKSVLLERGVDAVTMDEVAARAGTTKRTVYAHVHSKEALVAAVVGQSARRFAAGLPDPATLHADPVEAAVAYAAHVRALVAWRDPLGLQRLVLGELWRTPAHAALLVPVFDEAERRLGRFLAAHGVPAPDDAAAAVLAALVARSHLRALFGAEPPLDGPVPAAADATGHARAIALVRAITGR